MIPFGAYTQSDSIKISVEFYDLISTCPILLNECEQLSRIDSLHVVALKSQINNLHAENIELTEEVKRLKPMRLKWGVFGIGMGFVFGLLLN